MYLLRPSYSPTARGVQRCRRVFCLPTCRSYLLCGREKKSEKEKEDVKREKEWKKRKREKLRKKQTQRERQRVGPPGRFGTVVEASERGCTMTDQKSDMSGDSPIATTTVKRTKARDNLLRSMISLAVVTKPPSLCFECDVNESGGLGQT